jgi:hypothetical protein
MRTLIKKLHLRCEASFKSGGGRSRRGFVFGFIFGILIALFATNPFAISVFASDEDGETNDLTALWETDAAATSQEAELFLYEIESSEVPLAALPSMKTWALANLLIALGCVIVSAVTIVSLPASRRHASGTAFDEYGDYGDCIARDMLIFKLLGAGVGAASAVLFLLTENVRGTMQAANGYTWLMALILLTQIGILSVAFSGGKRLYGFDASMGIRS